MKYFIFLFFLLSLNSYSQITKIKGKVVEFDSEIPVPFAHVFIQDVMYGTITNEIGEFELTIESQLTNQQLTISCIGYADQLISISSIDESNEIIILKKSSTLLNDIVISAKEDSARLILKKTMKVIEKNYPKHKYLQNAFYRELGIKGNTHTRLIEAAITLQDNGYDAYDIDKKDWTVNNTRVKINEIRKSNDYRTYSLWAKIINALPFGDDNNLYKVLADDGIRFFGKNYGHYLSKEALNKYYEMHIEEIHQSGTDRIYQLLLTNKRSGYSTYRNINIYINSKDYAILKIQHEIYLRPNNSTPQYVTSEPILSTECTYSNYKGKYYLKYINTKRYATGGAASIIDDQKVIQFDQLTLMINEVYNKKDGFDRIRKKEQSNKSIDLYESKEKYNEEFWNNYNIILLHPLLNQVNKDLEKKESLELQFKKNEN